MLSKVILVLPTTAHKHPIWYLYVIHASLIEQTWLSWGILDNTPMATSPVSGSNHMATGPARQVQPAARCHA